MPATVPLNIVHVVFSFDYGGLERRILRLIDAFAPRGARFTIVSLRPSAGRFLPAGDHVRHVVLDARPGIDVGAVRRLARLIRASDAHVVHSHNWVSMLEGIVAGKAAGAPAVVHGEHGASRFEPERLSWKRTAVQRVLARSADAIVPVNEDIRDRIADVWRLSPARCTVIRNGVDTARFAPGPRRGGNGLVIGSVSRLEPVKNFPCLIRAVHRLNAATEDAPFRLVIVGEGGERPALEQLVDELGASAYVTLAGASDRPETWYPQFDVYVNSSVSEGMSNTVLEAMACGLPVVVSDVAGHRDWLEDAGNALFFASDDDRQLAAQIGTLGRDPTLRAGMGERNRRRVVDEFSQARFVEQYASLYRDLLRRKGIFHVDI